MADFSETVATMRGGSADNTASRALAQVVEAVRATGKAGSVTLKVIIKPLENGDGELKLSAKVGISLPTEEIKDSIYYPTEDNKLVRVDPRQLSMLADRTETDRNQREESLAQVGRGDVIDLQANR